MKTIPEKANFILGIVGVAFVVIVGRLIQLSVIEHDRLAEAAKRPQKRTVFVPGCRGTIRDRFNEVLVSNALSYRAAVIYSEIEQIPTTAWEGGKKVFPRKRYIRELSEKLGGILTMDCDELEDLIHSKASLLGSSPLVIKEELSEKEFCQMRALMGLMPGAAAEATYRREYPFGKVGCDVVGYMGAISAEQWQQLLQEIGQLRSALEEFDQNEEAFIPEGFSSWKQVRSRLKQLQEKAYSVNDRVGKAGVEASFERLLKGRPGKRIEWYDRKGQWIKEQVGATEPISGKRLMLSISRPLQAYAEKLLIESEARRRSPEGAPWIKGGAIIVIDPKTSEVLALASHPRFDPSDFVPTSDPSLQAHKNAAINRWLENESHIADLFDERQPLVREKVGRDESLWLSWSAYLDMVLPKADPIRDKLTTIGASLALQKSVEEACRATGSCEKEVVLASHSPLFAGIDHPADRLLLADLLRLQIDPELFDASTARKFEHLSLETYKEWTAAFLALQRTLKQELRESFRTTLFAQWREEHFPSFLKAKRAEEKRLCKTTKPYVDILKEQERQQFEAFWESRGYAIVQTVLEEESCPEAVHFRELLGNTSVHDAMGLCKTMRGFDQLKRALWGTYPRLRAKSLKGLAAAFYPKTGFGFGRSFAFRQACPLGSLFKIVPTYVALTDHISLSIIDNSIPGAMTVGSFPDGRPITRQWHGGRLPRSEHAGIGSVNLAEALETSSNPYFSLLAEEIGPQRLLDAARQFSFGQKTGIALPGEIAGRLPKDLEENKTGLFSFAIGQHSFDSTPLQGAVMLTAIANGGQVCTPQIHLLEAGVTIDDTPLLEQTRFPFKQTLRCIGVDFPLFTKALTEARKGFISRPDLATKSLHLPSHIQRALIAAMKRVVTGERGTARSERFRSLSPEALRRYTAPHFAGKTSTAEHVETLFAAKHDGAKMVKHTGFGAIFFEDAALTKPELVVVVYERFSDFGKESAPVAVDVYNEWRRTKEQMLSSR